MKMASFPDEYQAASWNMDEVLMVNIYEQIKTIIN